MERKKANPNTCIYFIDRYRYITYNVFIHKSQNFHYSMSSSSSVEPFRDVLNKPWKTFLFPTIKSDHFYLFLKLGLAISIIFLMSHFFYLSISYQKPQNHFNPLILKQMFQSEIPKILTSNTSQDPIPTNLSHIVFGLGGTYSTWENRRQYS